MATPRSSFQILAEKLPIFHPQPNSSPSNVNFNLPTTHHKRNSIGGAPRASRDWSLDKSRRTSIGLPTPGGRRDDDSKYSYGFELPVGFRFGKRRRGHRRQMSLSTFSVRGVLWGVVMGVVVVTLVIGWVGRGSVFGPGSAFGGNGKGQIDDGGVIPLGQSRDRNGREVFWWEAFTELVGYHGGWKNVVKKRDWISEQDGGLRRQREGDGVRQREAPSMVDVVTDAAFVPCHIDQEKAILPPKIFAFDGLPQGFPKPLFGSHDELSLRNDVCYDRLNRFGPYGYGFAEEEGGLGIKMEGDTEGRDKIRSIDYRGIQWGNAQDKCVAKKQYSGTRNAFIIRTWHNFEYTPFHIMMLRAIISELALTSGGKYTVHFLIHVQDDTIPIWASEEVYNDVLNSSLPSEFAGMGTLWSVAQMKFIYPPPFPDSIVNFSGDEIYKAYRSLHFPLQYFAQKHPEFEYFWQWEMDMRVTGGYLELLEQVSKWAERQDSDLLWEKSAQFFIPGLYNDSYATYSKSVKDEILTDKLDPISGPQLNETRRLSIPGVTNLSESTTVDFITFSPLFDPKSTRWAFQNDITGYSTDPPSRPPTRAALVTASRLSRRLLLTMHHETFQHKRTMFPEMFPASVALHYGYRAVYAPLPIYFDRDWNPNHANQVFNNAPLSDDAVKAGMDHGARHFHGEGGSVFGPGEHVFRGATWYSNAQFAGYLWRRWLGRETYRGDERDVEMRDGRMCLPMMVLHPVKND